MVAYNRNLLKYHRVSPEQLGKWAVLLDRWPEAGRAITKNPQLVRSLEDAAVQQDDFTSLCTEYAPPLASDLAPLRDFFQTDPKLAPAAYHLVYLDAELEPPAPSGAPATGPEADTNPAAAAPPDSEAPSPATVPNGRSGTNALTP